MLWLTLPFFALGLAGRLFITGVEVAFFRFTPHKILFWNTLLTLVALQLLLLLWILPGKPALQSPSLPLSITRSAEIRPHYLTLSPGQMSRLFQTYQGLVLGGDFISQKQYLNLAVLAATVQEHALAQQFFSAAQHIDPNQEFFQK